MLFIFLFKAVLPWAFYLFISFSFVLGWPSLSLGQSTTISPTKRLEIQLARIPKLGCHQALALFKAGKLILIDAHNDNNSKNTIIVGAIDIPLQKFKKAKLRFPKTALIACF